jgi:hypothetical protein
LTGNGFYRLQAAWKAGKGGPREFALCQPPRAGRNGRRDGCNDENQLDKGRLVALGVAPARRGAPGAEIPVPIPTNSAASAPNRRAKIISSAMIPRLAGLASMKRATRPTSATTKSEAAGRAASGFDGDA